jgi:hypothetical protein
MNILFLLFVTWQLFNTIGRFELFPSAGTVVVFFLSSVPWYLRKRISLFCPRVPQTAKLIRNISS